MGMFNSEMYTKSELDEMNLEKMKKKKEKEKKYKAQKQSREALERALKKTGKKLAKRTKGLHFKKIRGVF